MALEDSIELLVRWKPIPGTLDEYLVNWFLGVTPDFWSPHPNSELGPLVLNKRGLTYHAKQDLIPPTLKDCEVYDTAVCFLQCEGAYPCTAACEKGSPAQLKMLQGMRKCHHSCQGSLTCQWDCSRSARDIHVSGLIGGPFSGFIPKGQGSVLWRNPQDEDMKHVYG